MHLKKTLGLVAVIAVLLGLAWLRKDEAERTREALAEFLFRDVQVERVTSMHLTNTTQLADTTLERDRSGRWFMTDPVAFPAEPGMVKRVLDLLAIEAVPVDPDQVRLDQLELDPPRAVLSVTELIPVAPGDEPKSVTTVVELGAVDVGGSAVYVRTGGRILRTGRDFEGPIVHSDEQFRDHAILRFDPRQVIEIRRFGEIDERDGKGPRSVAFHALRDGVDWRIVEPVKIAADPAAIALLVTQIAGARASGFRDDTENEGNQWHQSAQMRFEITTQDHQFELFLVPAGGPTWLCGSVGVSHVFELSWETVRRLALPTDYLYEGRFSHVPPSEVQRVGWTRGQRSVEMWRSGDRWYVGEQLEGTAAAQPLPAAQGPADDWMNALELVESTVFLDSVSQEQLGDPADYVGVRFQVTSGDQYGGVFGPSYHADGGSGRLFRRAGDELWGVVSEDIFEGLTPEPKELWSPWLLRVDELTTGRVVLRSDSVERVFDRDAQTGRWEASGTGLSATSDFTQTVDALLNVKGMGWIVGDRPEEFEEWIEVDIVDRAGASTAYRLGRVSVSAVNERAAVGEDARIEVRSPAGRAEYSAKLFERVQQLLEPR